ncbi:tRNA (adenosine(37)-N6)-threonylcarbamoyltransferase complex transferase subunit TsaD [Candidatus Uhrbacteria bacterium]|jgi:N6-L-threonylcarbamoyladenine synthase|nr:tRNA (adenosine(37)-N6)-threonylcarbamoyltransferase complex transferase subunit TsaD [Candidatus Uhrbacteria bacterium]
MKVLAIESSCDETAVAIVEDRDGLFVVNEHVVASQIATHREFGGVIPEVAARLHVPVLPKMIEAMTMWKRGDIDAIAVTTGPGLSTALRVGVETAKALAVTWEIPLIPVDHIEGHIYANFLETSVSSSAFPILCLIVSGGHTELVLMKGHGDYELIGQTRDDAAGEAYDKTAAQLGLPYPGGPSIDKAALHGRRDAIDFPRPMLHSGDSDFSFSGLKTAVRYHIVKQEKMSEQDVADVAASFQQAVIDVLIKKTYKAAMDLGVRSVLLCGGVSASKELRAQLAEVFADTEVGVLMPNMKYTTDNAAMIGASGLQTLKDGRSKVDPFLIDADPGKTLGGPWKWEKKTDEAVDRPSSRSSSTVRDPGSSEKKRFETNSVHEMHEVAMSLVGELMDAHIVLLKGDLGSGKTTFAQGVAMAFGEEKPVRSPTFTLVNEYPVHHDKIDRIVHVDLYRLEKLDAAESRNLGLEVFLNDPRSLVLVEWPERAEIELGGLELVFTIEGETHILEKN